MIVSLEKADDAVDYAVGDVHGCLPQLQDALSWCSEDSASAGLRARVFLLGDYVDRGPDSRGVVELLMRGPSEPHVEWLLLRGNHDDMLSSVWSDPRHPEAGGWWDHGGQQTLLSYGWNPLLHHVPGAISEWIPKEHAEFLAALPLAAETPDRIYVHAGLRPGIQLAEQTPRDLMWIRGDFLHSSHDFGRPVVHGHTPDSGNPLDHGFRIAVDSGCFGSGILSVAAFDPGESRPRFATFGPDKRIRDSAKGFAP